MSVKSQSVVLANVAAVPSVEASRPWLYRSLVKRPLDVVLVVLASPVVLPRERPGRGADLPKRGSPWV